MKSNKLRKLIRDNLITLIEDYEELKNVFYRIADDKALYPHIVFSLDSSVMNSDDSNRQIYNLVVDVWDKGESFETVEDIADSVESLLNKENLPQVSILPTFWQTSRTQVYESDKAIKHIQLRFDVQNYER